MTRVVTKDSREICIFADQSALIDFAVEKWREIADIAVKEKGVFTVAVSGGKTPIELFKRLAQQADLPWSQTHIFLVDERMVPFDHKDSNYRFLKELLVDPLKLDTDNVHCIDVTTETIEKAAQRYEIELKMFFNLNPHQLPQFDLMTLGIGEDGHTASLFPDDPKTLGHKWLVISTQHENQHDRVSLTLPVINNSNHVMFLAMGENKADVIHKIVNKDEHLPAAQVELLQKPVLFLLDELAGAKIRPDLYQLSFYVPEANCEAVKNAMFAIGAGRLGDYDSCAWQTKGEGQFRPLANSKPHIGTRDKLEKITEYKVEMICEARYLDAAITALKQSHPYEEPAYQVLKLEN